ncbi:MAG TPA: carboxypeptidase regulatory-like domain-containing protein [Vicinamibacterales bacterium]|nr:carboxypeptidase regulatory-like domain-containing protein [Vicinamibacterales bacterium]
MIRPLTALCVLLTVTLVAQQPQQPSRDTSAQQNQKDAPPTPTGRITGRVVAGDSGRPIKRARVFINAAELPGGRGALTDDQGVFDLTELPAGRYTLTVSKSGFVSLAYGQRRPLQAGTPLQLLDGQQLKGVDFRLPRGSVIAGRIFDEDGEPMAGVQVRVMRYQYLQGERRLSPAGNGQTDDKGQFRVWGLMPGEYYVNAIARNFNFGGRGGGPFGGFGGGGRGGRGGPPATQPTSGDDEESLSYAPTYFPGVPSVVEAKPINVGLSEEVTDINFNMQLVRAARIAGTVTNPDGTPTSSGNVNLMTDGTIARGQMGANYGSRIDWDGSFEIANVPPGRYVLRARGTDTEPPQFASQPISVNGQDVDGVTVILAAGAHFAGTVTMLPGSTPPPDITNIRITAPSLDQDSFGPQQNARVDRDGKFTLDGVAAGTHLIRPSGGLRGWVLKSVTIDGRDVTDTPITLRSGQSVTNVAVTFTDKLSEITGTVTDSQGNPVPDFTVLAFSTDPSLWRAQSRQIMTARPDQTGKYRIRGLPPGDYYLATVDPTEQGEWFEPAYLDEHRAGASRIAISEGDSKTHDFKVTLR